LKESSFFDKSLSWFSVNTNHWFLITVWVTSLGHIVDDKVLIQEHISKEDSSESEFIISSIVNKDRQEAFIAS